MGENKVAIVGFSFRLPGDESGEFWSNLRAGKDLVTSIPEDRWSLDAYYHPGKQHAGTAYTTRAGTIGNIADFDAEFFGISPREAEQLDPQQRLLLEMAWEAFESGGIRPAAVRGTPGGVFIGFSGSDWSYRRATDLAALDATSMTGLTGSVAANRISYQFDLRGPSVAVDTACSSSLVAFHQACQSIASGESEFAMAGGISLHLHPFAFVGFARATMLSPRGICNVFDADGDGYVRSEGGGIFLLKPLEQALIEGNRIFGVVAASGVNCDGRTQGITVPGVETQAALLRDVYSRAGVDPAEVDYVEAHGTGTAVGDPIECRSLGMELGQNRSRTAPLPIGSVKSNVGHLETASGVAGLVKGILCLQHREIPPTIHLNSPNPHIQFDEWNLQVVTDATPLDPDKKLTIGINSFGFGGANAHVVLQSPDNTRIAANDEQAHRDEPDHCPPLILSGRGQGAVRAAASQLSGRIENRPDLSRYDIAYTAALHRDWHVDRAIAFAADPDRQLDDLRRYAAGEKAAGVVDGRALADASRPVFVYSGNGSQWAGMGRELLNQSECFSRSVETVDAIFRAHGDFSIVAELRNDNADQQLHLTEIAQPTLFAIQVGVTKMLREMGAEPAATVGHSVGEVAAAWASGALSLEQAVKVIHERSLQQGRTRGAGVMTAVGLDESACLALLTETGLDSEVALGGINSPRGVTLAGTARALEKFESVLAEREIFYRRLALDYAFHSSAMDPVRDAVMKDLADLKPRRNRIPFYSTVTGTKLSGNELDVDYWWRNIREPVRFQGAIDDLIDDGFNVFIEIGPHAVLRTYINDCLRSRSVEGRVVPTLQRDDGSQSRVMAAFYQLLVDGAPIDPHKLFPHPGRLVDIPTYPWQRKRFWHPESSEAYPLITRETVHPLLGYRLFENELQWENHLDLVKHPELADHAVGEAVVFPAAGYVEMVLAATECWQIQQHNDPVMDPAQTPRFKAKEIEELEILAPLLLEENAGRTVRLAIEPGDGRFTIQSRPRLSEDAWQLHVVGRIPGDPVGGLTSEPLAVPDESPQIPAEAHYRMTTAVGLNYGPVYQTVRDVWIRNDGVTARLAPTAAAAPEHALLHLPPDILDGCFQLLVDILRDEMEEAAGAAFVPVKIGRLKLFGTLPETSYGVATLIRRSPRSVVVNFALHAEDGELLALIEGVRFRAVVLRKPIVEHTGYLRYEPIARPLPMPRASLLPPNGQLPAACSRSLHAPERARARRQYYEEVEPLLDVLCAAFAQQALQQLSDDPRGVDVDRLLATAALHPDFEHFARNLTTMLLEDGILEPAGEAPVWSNQEELPAPATIWTSLLGDYPDYAAEILLLGRVGEHLAEVLSGELDVDALLPSDPSQPLLTHYLSGSPSNQALNRGIAEMVLAAVAGLAEGQRLRVLDFTDGYSQVADQLLPRLPGDRCDYVLAATDAQRLESMQPLLEQYPSVSAWQLDPTEEQSGEGFDVVILSQELARARQPDRLLALLADKLYPGGLLVVAERSSARWLEMVFGLRADWWQAASEYPVPRLQAAPAWMALLARYGLEDVNLVPDLPGSKSGPYLLLARSSQATPIRQRDEDASTGCWLVLHDAGGEGVVSAQMLAARLRAAGLSTCLAAEDSGFSTTDQDGVYRVAPDDAASLQQLFSRVLERHGELEGIVMLLGLPPQAGNSTTAGRRCIVAAELANACAAVGVAPELLLVTAGATRDLVPGMPDLPVDDAALWGFGRTLMNEYPDMHVRLLELADPREPEGLAAVLVDEILHADAEDEVIYAGAGRYAPRLRTVRPAALLQVPAASTDDRRANRLDFSHPGPLKNLRWRPGRLPEVEGERVEIEVRAAGLNFRDIMYAMGLLSDEAVEHGFAGATLGMELSGVITAVGEAVTDLCVGDEVIAFSPASFGERVVTPAAAVARKPDGWSFNAAATVPTTFFTAYYALHHLAQLEEGERLLIHGAAGGVGLAAIQLGRALGAEVFATAGSDIKRDVVRLLGADHVLDSRSLAFADDILALTNGEGVDVVLNSLAGEAINRNLRVLRPFGRFLELGKRDFYENTRIGLRPFRNNISYFGIDADQLMAERPELTRRLFAELMELFSEDTLKPLPYRAFPATQVVEAFRFMQQSRQIGKVVVNFEDGIGAVEQPSPMPQPLELSPQATYLVTGGVRGFGLETARWLVQKGARHLVLVSRRGSADDACTPTIDALRNQGTQVRVMSCDVTDREALADVFDVIRREMPPLRGIVHAAMVIDDGLMRSLSAERIRKVLAPKIEGGRHLDALSRDLDLDFFVLYSSATTLFGNPGQSSYVAANRYLEVLAHARRAQGLPAVCVSWGAIDDVGYLARNTKVKEQLQSRLGGSALSSAEALGALEQLLVGDLSGLGVMELDWGALKRFLPTALSPKYQELAHLAEEAGGDAEGLEQLQRWLEELDDDALAVVLTEALKKEIGEILHVPPERIEDERSLYEIGMDSLMGMEMVAAVETRFGVSIPLMALSEGVTVSRLVDLIVRRLRAPDGGEQEDGTQDLVTRVVGQHASDSDSGLLEDITTAMDSDDKDSRSLLGDR